MKTVILGASNKPERYANMALKRLVEHKHSVIPVHPSLADVDGIPCVKKISDIQEKIHTLTVYVGPEILEKNINDIIALAPERIILNPGTESETAENAFSGAGIKVVRGCTLVMLSTKQF